MAKRGRPPGKAKDNLLRRVQRKFQGYHPVIQLADIANNEAYPIEIRLQAAKELCQYVAPKRKAVEVKSTVKQTVSLTDLTGE
jgi:hypothetical protein